MYERRDKFYEKAKKAGYRARSSYKLIEIQDKYNLIKKNDSVLDIGCAPGSWLQVVKKYTRGKIFGVDIVPMKKVSGVKFIQEDVREIKFEIKFDVIISDIAPKTTGSREEDQFLSYELSRESFLVAKKNLKKKGNFLVKTFQSQDTEELVKEMKPFFEFVKRFVPKSTRQSSKELYIVALGFK